MSINRYYEDELAYLRDLGDAFGKANPAIAGLLSRRASDPDVERLMEGFAFLTGRLRQRLDEELPELSHGLLSLLWPHYLRPIPAMSILEFAPPSSGAVVRMPAEAPVESRPIEGSACRFRTCFASDLLPFVVSRATLEEGAASAVLTLVLTSRGGAAPALLAGVRPRLFLHGGRAAGLGQRLLRLLLTDLVAIEAGPQRLPLPVAGMAHAGYGPGEAVLPWPDNAFPGYRIMQEYLAFPDRFLFVDLPPLPDAALAGAEVELRFLIGRKPDLPGRIGPENFRLNCVPVINLYPAEVAPLSPDPGRLEHRLVPEWPASRFARVHSVDRVEGAVQGRGERIPYPAFESFRHALPAGGGRFYRARRRPSVVGRGTEVWLSFVDGRDQAAGPEADVISAAVTCTDGELAELVPIGGIDQVAVGSPASGGFSNITPVMPEASPPLGGDTLWRLVSGLARSLRPLDDIGSLAALIAGYDFRATQDEQARQRLGLLLGGLKSIQVDPMEVLIGAIPVRGRLVTLTVAESGFGGAAGAFLFGAVFDAFIGVHAGLNTCYRLTVRGTETSALFTWPVRAGQGPVL